MAMKPPKKRVDWKVPAGERKPIFLPQYVNYSDYSGYEKYFVVGSLWCVANYQMGRHERCYELEGRLPILGPNAFAYTFRTGDLLMYAGVVRVTEQKADKTNSQISVKRHSFFAKGVKYIVRDLSCLHPVT